MKSWFRATPGGKTFFGAKITVRGDRVNPQRMMVAIGTSPLR